MRWRAAVVGLSLALGLTAPPVALTALQNSAPPAAPDALYYCPMHPDVTAASPGRCARCGMALVAGDPFDLREYLLDVASTPTAPRVRQNVRLAFTVRHPSTRKVIDQFALVHEKPYHLFVISQDLEFYDHVHPEPQADGSYVINIVLPKPGYYRLFSDFLPVGG
ncbi:MAG: heavy metal-binding domain-containing protein, partial [Vicinamibacterales bacterium]